MSRVERGRSSIGRAPALQAGGRRFDSVRLHCFGRLWVAVAPNIELGIGSNVDAGCGTMGAVPGTALDRPLGWFEGGRLFMIVNQVLVRLWMRRTTRVVFCCGALWRHRVEDWRGVRAGVSEGV